jgi:hypothetical protein
MDLEMEEARFKDGVLILRDFLGKFFAIEKGVPPSVCEALSGTNKQESRRQTLVRCPECNPISKKLDRQYKFVNFAAPRSSNLWPLPHLRELAQSLDRGFIEWIFSRCG